MLGYVYSESYVMRLGSRQELYWTYSIDSVNFTL
jgi:hypothetical protein